MKRALLVCGAFFALAAFAFADLDEGAKLFGEGKYPEALDVLKKEINDHPTNTKAYMVLASCYEKMEKWTEAAGAWAKFVKLTESADERSFGEKRQKECLDRASGKVPVETPKTPDTPADTTAGDGDFAKYETSEPVFSSKKTAHFLIQAKNRALLEQTASEAERHLSRITNVYLFGRDWPHLITIRVFKNHAEYVSEAGMPQWSGGGYSIKPDGAGGVLRAIDLYACDDKGKFIPELLTKTLPHEMTHVVINEFFGERTWATLPLALNEGLAMYSEEGTDVLYERQLSEVVKKGTFFKLGDLYHMTRYPRGAEALFYAQAASATRYMVEHLKGDQFRSFMEEIRKGNTVDSALQTALGRTEDCLKAMETNWVSMLKEKADYYAKHPLKIDPATGRPIPEVARADTPKKPDEAKKPDDAPKPADTAPKPDSTKVPSDDDKDVIEEYK